MRLDLLEPWKNAMRKNFYQLSDCSMCGYKTGWKMFRDMPDGIAWDGGCYCVTYDGRRYVDDDEFNFFLNPDHGHIEKIEKFIEENK